MTTRSWPYSTASPSLTSCSPRTPSAGDLLGHAEHRPRQGGLRREPCVRRSYRRSGGRRRPRARTATAGPSVGTAAASRGRGPTGPAAPGPAPLVLADARARGVPLWEAAWTWPHQAAAGCCARHRLPAGDARARHRRRGGAGGHASHPGGPRARRDRSRRASRSAPAAARSPGARSPRGRRACPPSARIVDRTRLGHSLDLLVGRRLVARPAGRPAPTARRPGSDQVAQAIGESPAHRRRDPGVTVSVYGPRSR